MDNVIIFLVLLSTSLRPWIPVIVPIVVLAVRRPLTHSAIFLLASAIGCFMTGELIEVLCQWVLALFGSRIAEHEGIMNMTILIICDLLVYPLLCGIAVWFLAQGRWFKAEDIRAGCPSEKKRSVRK